MGLQYTPETPPQDAWIDITMQTVDNYEYEMPSDFEDEEIDEEAAFNEEDKKLYAEWFGKETSKLEPAGDADDQAGLLDSGEEGSGGEEEDNPDDYSDLEVSLLLAVQ